MRRTLTAYSGVAANLCSTWILFLSVLTAFADPIVSNTNDGGAGSLRQAIADAAAGNTITFAPGVSGAITLTSGELVIGTSLNISGPGPASGARGAIICPSVWATRGRQKKPW